MEESLGCVFCDERFPSRPLLQAHFRQHGAAGGPPRARRPAAPAPTTVSCDVCSETFDCVSRAIHHKFKKHADVQVRHFCHWCGKRFPIKHTLDAHVKTHAGEILSDEKFTCNLCDVTFYKEEGLDYHRVSYHDNTVFEKKVLVPPPSKKIYINSCGDIQSAYYCHLCGQEYVVKYNLQKHIGDKHGLDSCSFFTDIIKCNICDALFYNEKAYAYHNSFHKTTDMYVTDEEMRLNVITKIDQDFDLRRVRSLFTDNEGKSTKMTKTMIEELLKQNKSETNSDSSDCTNEIVNCATVSSDNLKPFESKKLKNKRKATSKVPKNAVLLDDFVNMNKDIFSFNGKSTIVDIREVKIEPPDDILCDANDLSEPNSSMKNVPIGNERNGKSRRSTDNPEEISNSTIKRDIIKKPEPKLKYLTKEQLEKLKSKGLIQLTTKPASLHNVKKISIIESAIEKPCSNTNRSHKLNFVNSSTIKTSNISKRIKKRRCRGNVAKLKDMNIIDICEEHI